MLYEVITNSMIMSQGIGDLYPLYVISRRDGVDYNLAYIPPNFDVPKEEAFDPKYMDELFSYNFV